MTALMKLLHLIFKQYAKQIIIKTQYHLFGVKGDYIGEVLGWEIKTWGFVSQHT